MKEPFVSFYRCPESVIDFTLGGELSPKPGYFRLGRDTIGFGRSLPGHAKHSPAEGLCDVLPAVTCDHSGMQLPFDLTEVIDNLRLERYAAICHNSTAQRLLHKGYYSVRPLLPFPVRRYLQRAFHRGWQQLRFPCWPVDTTVEQIFETLLAVMLKTQKTNSIPFIWFWPNGAPACAIMTHDVESKAGVRFCSELMDIDEEWAIKASFQIVPEARYRTDGGLLEEIRERGFEVNVQDLNHDGLLFGDHRTFLRRAESINKYARLFGSKGFRAGALYRNPDWYDAFDFSYDMSIPNTAHLDPQRGGCCTVFPYFIGNILELPLTTTQDYMLFHILQDYSTELWKRQARAIREKNGLVSFIAHPDYLIARQARKTYVELLRHLAKLRSDHELWLALPRDVDAWWRERARLTLVQRDRKWVIEGKGSERARVAYASLERDRVVYRIEPPAAPHLAAAVNTSRSCDDLTQIVERVMSFISASASDEGCPQCLPGLPA